MEGDIALIALCLLVSSVILLLTGHVGLAMMEFLGFYLYCSFAGG
jgi:hypothetical protein